MEKITQWLKVSWLKRIEMAAKEKSFSESDIRLSCLWITDLFSELIDIVEFKNNQLHLGPKDINLVIDGIYFTKAIEDGDIGLALNCMKSINKRVLKLYGIEPWKNVEKIKYNHAN